MYITNNKDPDQTAVKHSQIYMFCAHKWECVDFSQACLKQSTCVKTTTATYTQQKPQHQFNQDLFFPGAIFFFHIKMYVMVTY